MKKNLMHKILLSLLVASVAIPAAAGFAACGSEENTQLKPPVEDSEEQQLVPTHEFLTEYDYDFVTTLNLDESYKAECSAENKGKVEYFTYEAHSYVLESLPENAGKDITLQKTAQVYLPAGYDPEGEYDILYLLHGTGNDQEKYWFEVNPTTLNVLDNMIYNGDCKPTIVVCPNYYSIPEDYEDYIGMSILNDPNADLWPMYFYRELRETLIPAIETKYATYAKGDVSLDNLQATREHRAFAGLSRGSMTVVNSGMIHCTDLFAYFGSYSGIWADYDKFAEAMTGEFADYDILYWYNGTGTADTVGEPQAMIDQQIFTGKVLEGLPDKFVDGENFSMVIIEKANHSYAAWLIDLYNSMLVFFQTDTAADEGTNENVTDDSGEVENVGEENGSPEAVDTAE